MKHIEGAKNVMVKIRRQLQSMIGEGVLVQSVY